MDVLDRTDGKEVRITVVAEYGSLERKARIAASNMAMESLVHLNAAGKDLIKQCERQKISPRQEQVIRRNGH